MKRVKFKLPLRLLEYNEAFLKALTTIDFERKRRWEKAKTIPTIKVK